MDKLNNNPNKALFLYSEVAGSGKIKKYLDKIVNKLQSIFAELEIKKIESIESMLLYIDENKDKYHSLILAGGDGTLHHLVNHLVKTNSKLVLGYIPTGTLNDGGKNFGVGKSYKSALKVIEKNNIQDIDVVKFNDQYFVYTALNGAFSDVSYIHNNKKKIGFFSYYLLCIKEAFTKYRLDIEIENNDEVIKCNPSFIAIMNGNYLGGFKIGKNNIQDSKLEILIPKYHLFNGFWSIILHLGLRRIVTDKVKIKINSNKWSLDGEAYDSKEVNIEVIPSILKIYCK